MRDLRRAEIVASTMLAGSRLDAHDVAALLDNGRAVGNHAFADYVLVRDYADAAHSIADSRRRPPGSREPLLTLEELRALNARAAASSVSRGGTWRRRNVAPQAGIVAPAAWLVAREVDVLLDRFGRGPGDGPTGVWLARFFGRFTRLQPFETANGRTGRLAANLMLQRIDFPPLVFGRRERLRLPAALAAAETSDPLPLAALVAVAILRTCDRLIAGASPAAEPLLPLRDAAGADYGALAKAAQRGRLRTLLRGGRYWTTAGWIAEYRAGAKRPTPPDDSDPRQSPESLRPA